MTCSEDLNAGGNWELGFGWHFNPLEANSIFWDPLSSLPSLLRWVLRSELETDPLLDGFEKKAPRNKAIVD